MLAVCFWRVASSHCTLSHVVLAGILSHATPFDYGEASIMPYADATRTQKSGLIWHVDARLVHMVDYECFCYRHLFRKWLRCKCRYMPPEVMCAGQLTTSTDIYSFGLLMWEVMTCQFAFAAETAAQIFYRVVQLVSWTSASELTFCNVACQGVQGPACLFDQCQ